MPQDATTKLKSTYKKSEVNSFPPSELKQDLFDCLRKKTLNVGSSVQRAGPKEWLIKCFEFRLQWSRAPRRYLTDRSYGHIKPVPAPYLASEPAAAIPVYNPAPSYSALTMYSSLIPPTQPLFRKKLREHQQNAHNSPPPPHKHKTPKHSPPKSKAPKHEKPHDIPKRKKPRPKDDIQNQVLIAIVATATVTFCFASALFCCWVCCRRRNNRFGSKDRQRDDRPLLRLSDYLSASSSQNSSGFRNYAYKDYSSSSGKSMSFRSNISLKNGSHGPSLAEPPLSKANGEGFPLKLPPGRLAPPPPEPPPPPAPPAPPPPPAPRPPPLPKPKAGAPPAPPLKTKSRPSSFGSDGQGLGDSDKQDDDNESGSTKAKLKPFFWDKVMASPNHSMVWHDISAGSFQ